MKVANASKPKLAQLFEDMLWVNTPKDWALKSAYFQGTLFVSILIETPLEGQYQKIRRSFGLDVLHSRSTDIWGLAADCVDEMKTEINR